MSTKVTPTHIFIVDNNKMYVNMLDYIFLKDLNHRFINYTSGEECLTNMHLNPDLIVLDDDLPGMNGYDTLVKIKKDHPNAYVLSLISDKNGKLPSDLFEAGADDYILKEVSGQEELHEKIESFLSRASVSKKMATKSRPSLKQMTYLILALLLVSAGVYYSSN